MPTIPDYPPPPRPLDPTDPIAGWQDGAQRAIPAAAFAALGAAAAQPNIDAANARIDALIAARDAPRVASLTVDKPLVEIGSTEDVIASWVLTAGPASQTFAGNSFGPQVRSAPLHGPWNANRSVTLTVADGSTPPNTASANVSVSARVPIFAGFASTPMPSDATILASPYKALDSDHVARTIVLARDVGGFAYIVLPAAMSVTTLRAYGLPTDGWALSAPFDLTLGTGTTVSMRRLSLTQAQSADTQPLTMEIA